MIDTKALREKVLDLAIRGKLVPQDPNDEPASVLLKKIREQKKQMVKDGKLKAKDIKNDTIIFKGDDNLHYEQFADATVKCIEDEIPFEVPEGWEWARLVNVTSKIIDGSHNPPKASKKRTDYIMASSKNINNDNLCNLDDVRYISKEEYEKENARTQVTINDILLTAVATLGRSCVFMGNVKNLTFQRSVSIITTFMKPEYLKYYFDASYFQKHIENNSTGNAQKGFYLNQLEKVLVCMPPFSEQQRIADCIERYNAIIGTLETDIKSFKDTISVVKSKILDLAIRGQLVPQDPNDELASVLLDRIRAEKEELIKAGKIKRDKKESVIFKCEDNSYYEKVENNIKNIADKIPFEIPESWTFVRLEDVLDYEQPTPYIVKSTDYKYDYQTPVLTAGKSLIIGYTNETYGIKTELPVIIFDDFTTDSKYVDFPFKVKSSAMKILTAKEKLITTKFAYYAMQVVECDNYNHKRYWISEFSKKLIPLPPKNEQVKIVNAIEELYKYIEQTLS